MNVEPLAIFHPDAQVYQGENRFALVKLTGETSSEMNKTIENIEQQWKSINSSYPFEYSFMDANFDAAFSSQRRFGKVMDIFSVLAVIITLVGLIGLISFNVEQRTKEFGIRKVLGASTFGLTQLIITNFAKLISIALVIGTAASWYYGTQWLDNFIFRTPISPLIYLASAVLLVSVVLTVSFAIVFKNSLRNPSTILRDE
jgi:putative ABC transport system permease protein